MSQAFFTPFPSEGSGGSGSPGAGSIVGAEVVTVDFGFASGQEGFMAVTPVIAAWVSANTVLFAQISPDATADHDSLDAAAEGLTAYIANVIPGVGFDVVATAPRGTWGQYKFNVVGVE